MDFRDWYTDRMDIYRTEPVEEGALTRQERRQIATGAPCRLFHTGGNKLTLEREAASVGQSDWVQCGNEVDVRAGDELIIRPGAELNRQSPPLRAFAGQPNQYFEPFGAALPGLAHQEIPLERKERT